MINTSVEKITIQHKSSWIIMWLFFKMFATRIAEW